MYLIYGQDEAVAIWVFAHLGLGPPNRSPYVAIGVVDDAGRPTGGMVFNDWNGANIEITVYAPHALTRQAMRAAYAYVFGQVGACRLTAKTKRNNAIMKKLLPRYGFKFEGVLRNYYGPNPADDALIFRLDPQAAAKWM